MKRKKMRPEDHPSLFRPVVSPEYAELERNGKLRRVLEKRIEHRKLMIELHEAGAEIRKCADLAWCDKFAMKMIREGKAVYKNLQLHFDRLDVRRRKLLVQTNKLFQELVALDVNVVPPNPSDSSSGSTISGMRGTFRTGRNANVQAQYRDFTIQMNAALSNEDLCKRLDFDLERRADGSVSGLPENWTKQYGVKTFVGAYANPKCKSLVQKMISKAKQGI